MSFGGEVPRRYPTRIVTPAPGAEMVVKPVTVGAWRLLSLVWVLVTSAAVAIRNVQLTLTDGSVTYWLQTTAVTQAATTTQQYKAEPQAIATASISGLVTLPLPPDGLYIPRGHQLATITALIDVADQYSAIVAQIQELPDGPDYTTEPSMPLNVIPADW
jgi:hypothetical protein